MKNIDRREFLSGLALAGAGLASIGPVQVLANNYSQKITRIGIIGLDTSQVTMIISHINNIPGPGYDVVQPLWDSSFEGFKVTAAYPYGSKKIESSIKQIPTYVGKMKENGVELVDSIKTLLSKVDAVMLMTFDGHPRVEQAMEVIKAGKPLFINKPFAASLKDVIKIMDAAKKYNCPIFSSSPTRYLKGAQAARNGSIGDIMGADSYSGCPLEPTHPDFYWYGIHGIEILFTIMGKDCQTVQRNHTLNTDHVVGIWDNDRIGTYRGIRKGKVTHSGVAYGLNEILPAGSFNDVGHRPLVIDMLKFFKTGISPVSIEETLAIHVFMEAADESKRQGGAPVSMQAVLAKAQS
ncbi:MAG: Gfo/Idh/MocA family oxidoreductase [Pedobacter sp.]|nr:Gfo/Idh/MocA family oxidoreductase [Pedobacter sp.]